MYENENEKLIPQVEEDITEIVWAKKPEMQKYTSNNYPTITEILKTEK